LLFPLELGLMDGRSDLSHPGPVMLYRTLLAAVTVASVIACLTADARADTPQKVEFDLATVITHGARAENVCFVENESVYVLTAGGDETIRAWDKNFKPSGSLASGHGICRLVGSLPKTNEIWSNLV
jgi:hypothetical protein